MLKTYRTLQKHEDIIHLPHPVSKKHPQMGRMERAAQFAPFAALTGHGEAILEAARVTEEKKELSEDVKESLDKIFESVRKAKKAKIKIVYFEKDPYKKGGARKTVIGSVRKIQENERKLVLDEGSEIPFDDIYEIKYSQEC